MHNYKCKINLTCTNALCIGLEREEKEKRAENCFWRISKTIQITFHPFTLEILRSRKTMNQTNLQVPLVNLQVSSFYVRGQRWSPYLNTWKHVSKRLWKYFSPTARRQHMTLAPHTFLSVTQTVLLGKLARTQGWYIGRSDVVQLTGPLDGDHWPSWLRPTFL